MDHPPLRVERKHFPVEIHMLRGELGSYLASRGWPAALRSGEVTSATSSSHVRVPPASVPRLAP